MLNQSDPDGVESSTVITDARWPGRLRSQSKMEKTWPSKVLHPTNQPFLLPSSQLCNQFSKERSSNFCDFHGQVTAESRRKNIFMYGLAWLQCACLINRSTDRRKHVYSLSSHHVPNLPLLRLQLLPIRKPKVQRINRENGPLQRTEMPGNLYETIESSFCGNDIGPYKNYHFSTNNLMQTGRDFCRTLMLYLPYRYRFPRVLLRPSCRTSATCTINHYKIISEGRSEGKMKWSRTPKSKTWSTISRGLKSQNVNKEIQSKHIKKGWDWRLF